MKSVPCVSRHVPANTRANCVRDAWELQEAPQPLPVPLQSFVSELIFLRVPRLVEGGHEGATQLATSFVGQGVGLMN